MLTPSGDHAILSTAMKLMSITYLNPNPGNLGLEERLSLILPPSRRNVKIENMVVAL